MSTGVENIIKNSDLRKRILFSLAMLTVFRLGVHIPTPGVDAKAVLKFFSQQGGIFSLFNTFSGGALNQFSIFALGIMPYISSSIIFQLLTAVVPQLEALKKEGEPGRKKITQYTRYLTVVLACFQGFAMSTWLQRQDINGAQLVLSKSVGYIPFSLLTVFTLTAGTCFIMWLGEQISERGLGDGSSLIIFSGIAAGIPSGALNLILRVFPSLDPQKSQALGDNLSLIFALGIVALMVIVIYAIIFLEVGQRRIPIHFSQRGGRLPGGSQASHLPLKINLTGVIPPIFASSLLLFPATLAQFQLFHNSSFLEKMKTFLSPASGFYNFAYVGLIIFFSFFYTEFVFNPSEIADNLKKSGKFIPGIRAGRSTAEYIQRVIDRITVAGAIYLSVICVLPTLFINKLHTTFYFGGTSLLILVGVALNTTQQIQSYLWNQKYEGFMRGAAKVRTRRVQY